MKRKLGPTEDSKVRAVRPTAVCLGPASCGLELSFSQVLAKPAQMQSLVCILAFALCMWVWSDHFSLIGPQGPCL